MCIQYAHSAVLRRLPLLSLSVVLLFSNNIIPGRADAANNNTASERHSMMQELNLIFIWWLETIDSSGKKSHIIILSVFSHSPVPSNELHKQTGKSKQTNPLTRTHSHTYTRTPKWIARVVIMCK
jgi:hypothetical protein